MNKRWRYVLFLCLAFAAAPVVGIALAEFTIWAIKVKPWMVLR